ncbi:MAG: hypothetical protein HOP28_03390, partial [Gemmatimonadales bacterium]|nr:hypothetical protein [Gemmatimonadales bacterium]
NDHARHGAWATPAGPARAAGSLLRAAYPDDTYSIGLFMGSGSIADNSRQIRQMIPAPEGGLEHALAGAGTAAGYLLLDGGRAARAWAERRFPYLRAGLAIDTLAPGREFDALIYADRVSPAAYRLP